MSFLSGEETVGRFVGLGSSFLAHTDINTVVLTSEYSYMYLKNPAESSKTIVITHYMVGINASTTRSIWNLYADPEITDDGEAITPVNTYIKDSPNPSGMEVYKGSTASSMGTLLNKIIQPANTPSRGVNRIYWVDPGHSLLFTVQNNIVSTPSFVGVHWIEL